MKVLSISNPKHSDLIGAFASGFCLLHCLATPLLFIAQTYSTAYNHENVIWWQWMDYVFLAISFAAIYRSNQTSSKTWVGKALWVSWTTLLLIILNEKSEWVSIPEYIIYLPSLALIFLHIYSQKHCQCSDSCIHQNT